MASGNHGRRLTDVVARAWRGGFFVDSLFARRNAAYISAASSLGYISTLIEPGMCGRQWWVTGAGLQYLDSQKENDG